MAEAIPKRSNEAGLHLSELEASLTDLKVQYEQFFLGLAPLPPEKLHQHVKRQIRELRKFPFKTSHIRFKLQALERRYQTFNNYWQRVLREKEAGVYFRDVFKADLRVRETLAEEESHTAKGTTERFVQGLFKSYQEALERNTGKKQDLDYSRFRDELIKRAKLLKEQAQGKKVKFKVVDKGGRVTLQATIAGPTPPKD